MGCSAGNTPPGPQGRTHPWEVVDASLPVLSAQKVSRKTTVLVAGWIQQELCKSLDSLCWKGNYNREELCCFLAGISLHLVLVCRSLPSIRLTSGGLLSSQIILNLSFVNVQELASCFFLDVLPQNDVFIHIYLKCAGRFSAHSSSYPKNWPTFHHIKENKLFSSTVE